MHTHLEIMHHRDMMCSTNVPFDATKILRYIPECCELLTTGNNREHNVNCTLRSEVKEHAPLAQHGLIKAVKIEQLRTMGEIEQKDAERDDIGA